MPNERLAGELMIPNLAQIEELGTRILGEQPDPVVRFRVLRDVLQKPSRDPELASARGQVTESHWVAELREEQRPDGSWGRFHSADTRAKRRIPTTEAGVPRALALGLNGSHPVLAAAAKYVADVLTGARDFPDPAEKNERWRTEA
ncbi:hypothetical protein AMK68_04450 [candidate division KD3-62 bacterium DG_56]|uniref:Uncharacterized protein n=1 Tax=candidate division KD3-62 bacterium DG_56 TaxID=1704032 RepID=A0A0S7XK34_9BACT|nr:MAG: hypothetical protein AMK68_04450 [candidate division KD3-62 bacterium DG_56]